MFWFRSIVKTGLDEMAEPAFEQAGVDAIETSVDAAIAICDATCARRFELRWCTTNFWNASSTNFAT
jgi:hypothetical protein